MIALVARRSRNRLRHGQLVPPGGLPVLKERIVGILTQRVASAAEFDVICVTRNTKGRSCAFIPGQARCMRG
jgi:hypothetical protein